VNFDYGKMLSSAKLVSCLTISTVEFRSGDIMGIDFLDAMKDPPPDIDLPNAKVAVFPVDTKKGTTSAKIVIYDDSDYYEVFSRKDILELVERRELAGIVIETSSIADMIMRLLDSHVALRMNPSEEERLRLCQKIYDLLEPTRMI